MTVAGRGDDGRKDGTCVPVRVVFLYNAGSGALEAVIDSARKLAHSRTACALCAVTHGALRKRKSWSEIECSLGFPVAYFHRDEIPGEAGDFLRANELRLPTVLFEMADGGYRTAVTAGEIEDCRAEPQRLRDRIEESLDRLRSP